MDFWRRLFTKHKSRSLFILFYSFLIGASFAWAQGVEEAVSVPAGLNDSDYQRLLASKYSLDQERGALTSDIELLNSDCGHVSANDTAKVQSCQQRHHLIVQRIERYSQGLQTYQTEIGQAQTAAVFVDSDVVDLRDATTDVVNINTVKRVTAPQGLKWIEPQTPEEKARQERAKYYRWVQQKREEANREYDAMMQKMWVEMINEATWIPRTPDPDTRWINPLWIEEVVRTLDQDKLALEAAMNDPRMQEVTLRAMAFEKEKKQYEKKFFEALNAAKKELAPRYPHLTDPGLDLQALKDSRVAAATRRWMEFEKTSADREASLNKEFFETLEIAKNELAEKKAEAILRDRWRKEAGQAQ